MIKDSAVETAETVGEKHILETVVVEVAAAVALEAVDTVVVVEDFGLETVILATGTDAATFLIQKAIQNSN